MGGTSGRPPGPFEDGQKPRPQQQALDHRQGEGEKAHRIVGAVCLGVLGGVIQARPAGQCVPPFSRRRANVAQVRQGRGETLGDVLNLENIPGWGYPAYDTGLEDIPDFLGNLKPGKAGLIAVGLPPVASTGQRVGLEFLSLPCCNR